MKELLDALAISLSKHVYELAKRAEVTGLTIADLSDAAKAALAKGNEYMEDADDMDSALNCYMYALCCQYVACRFDMFVKPISTSSLQYTILADLQGSMLVGIRQYVQAVFSALFEMPIRQVEQINLSFAYLEPANRTIDYRFEAAKLVEQLVELQKAKDADYGSSFHQQFQLFGPLTGIVRLYDKVLRLESLQSNEAKVTSESSYDTAIDLVNYATLILREQLLTYNAVTVGIPPTFEHVLKTAIESQWQNAVNKHSLHMLKQSIVDFHEFVKKGECIDKIAMQTFIAAAMCFAIDIKVKQDGQVKSN